MALVGILVGIVAFLFVSNFFGHRVDAQTQLDRSVSIYVEDCYATLDGNEGSNRIVVGADIVVSSMLPLGVDAAQVSFELFRSDGTRRGEKLATLISEEKGVIGLSRQSFNIAQDLDRPLMPGEYVLGCTLKTNGANLAYYPTGWAQMGDTVEIAWEYESLEREGESDLPFRARLHIDKTKDVVTGEEVVVSLVLSSVDRPLNAKLTMHLPSGVQVMNADHGDCSGNTCASTEYKLSPAAATRSLNARIVSNESGAKKIRAVIDWYEEGSDPVSTLVDPIQLQVIETERRLNIIPTAVSTTQSGESPDAERSLIEEFWLHIIVGVIASMLLATIGWITRHMHVKPICNWIDRSNR